jgi:hypothetical protein
LVQSLCSPLVTDTYLHYLFHGTQKPCEMKVGRELANLVLFLSIYFSECDEISPVHHTLGYLLYHNYGTWRIGNHA